MGNQAVAETAKPPAGERSDADAPGARPRTRPALASRAVLATAAAMCATAAVLSLVALNGGMASKSPPSNAAMSSQLTAATATPAAAKGVVAPEAASTDVAVSIQSYAFSPASLTIGVGTTVTWTNYDTAPHTVTVSSGPVKFNSPTLQKGDTYTYTFTTAGTYSYYCAVHPDMTAKVVVTGTAPTTTSPPTTSSSMTMSPPSSSETCAVSTALQTFLTHLNAAHLSESPAEQAQDILDLNRYIGLHMALVQNMLAPLTEGGLSGILSDSLSTFLTHVNTAHLGESPAEQAQDIVDVNQYLGSHMALIESMLGPIEAQTC
jgi:plastocyanin